MFTIFLRILSGQLVKFVLLVNFILFKFTSSGKFSIVFILSSTSSLTIEDGRNIFGRSELSLFIICKYFKFLKRLKSITVSFEVVTVLVNRNSSSLVASILFKSKYPLLGKTKFKTLLSKKSLLEDGIILFNCVITYL